MIFAETFGNVLTFLPSIICMKITSFSWTVWDTVIYWTTCWQNAVIYRILQAAAPLCCVVCGPMSPITRISASVLPLILLLICLTTQALWTSTWLSIFYELMLDFPHSQWDFTFSSVISICASWCLMFPQCTAVHSLMISLLYYSCFFIFFRQDIMKKS